MTPALDLPNELWEIIFFHVHNVGNLMDKHKSLSRYPADTVPRLAINRRLFPLNRAAFASCLSIHLLCSFGSIWSLAPFEATADHFRVVSYQEACGLLERMPFSLSSAVRSVIIKHHGHWEQEYLPARILQRTKSQFDRQVPADVERFNELLIEKLPDATTVACERLSYMSIRPSLRSYIWTTAPNLLELKLMSCPVQANRLFTSLATTKTLRILNLDNVVVTEPVSNISRQPFTTCLRALSLSGAHTSPALEVIRRRCLERSPSLVRLTFSPIGSREDVEMIAASSASASLRVLAFGFWAPNTPGSGRRLEPTDLYTLADFMSRTKVETLSLPAVPKLRSEDGFSVHHLKELLVATPSLSWLIFSEFGVLGSFQQTVSGPVPSLLEGLVAALDSPGALPRLSQFTYDTGPDLELPVEGYLRLRYFIRERDPLDRRANRQALQVVAHHLGLRSTRQFLEPLVQ